MRAEMDNVRTALDWAFSAAGDRSIGIALTAVYVPVWMQFAMMVECRQRTERALSLLEPGPADGPMRVLLHIGLGITLNHTGGVADDAYRRAIHGLEDCRTARRQNLANVRAVGDVGLLRLQGKSPQGGTGR